MSMRDKLQQGSTAVVSVAGIEFRYRRRTTDLMLQIGDVREVFGIMAGALKATEGAGLDAGMMAKGSARLVEMQKKAVPLILVAIDGEPVGEGNPVLWEDVSPYMDTVFSEFLDSGLRVDPTPDSSQAPEESS